mmetsp:Transcript_75950/g.93257  ORF Transcript_75950/g.93257 Transcript_75950/m.93257 type:complete len:133 (+) Transcript_75950:37-435(+)
MGAIIGGPPSEAKGNTVQLVFTTTCCAGMKSLNPVPAWLNENFAKIKVLAEPYGQCLCWQMDCCGSPVCPSKYADESQNAPLKALRSQFPQYTFSFRPEWVGFGKHAHWEHILTITNAPSSVGQVVGQQQMS